MRRLLLVALVLSAAACGDDESDESADTRPPAEKQEAPEKKLPCKKADKEFVATLKSSLTTVGGGGLKRVSVVKLDSPPEGFGRGGAFAVAAELTGEGMEGTTGIWAANGSKPGDGLIIGADSVTREFSEFGAAARPGSPAADYAAEVAESEAGQRAIECAEGR